MKEKFSIAVIDDDVALASNLEDILEAEGYHVESVNDGSAGIELFRKERFDLALVDIKLPHLSGPELIKKLSVLRPETEYILITAYAGMETAVAAVKQKQIIGYENKPVNMDRLLMFIRQVMTRRRVEEEKERLETQLQQTRKMDSIAILAGGIAHEFNNALMGIMGNIELLRMDSDENEIRDNYFETMKRSGYRMSRLTDQLLAYAEGGKYQPKNLKMDDFVMEILPILQHDVSPAVRVETHFQKDISSVMADHAQMQMVFSALLFNSNEAIEGDGVIKISVGNENIDEDFTKYHPDLMIGPYVCLTIDDDGKGMDEKTKNGIFEPFFTTKFQGRGMGMAAVHGIVKNHAGWISVDSKLGKGTSVRLYLPAIEMEEETPKKPKVEMATGSETVLVIEDEEVVIDVTQAMLEMLGYRVMVAKTGKEAVRMTKTFDGQIDLALLDIKLPDMEGGKVYPLIMKARPDLKVIVFSGYSIEGPAQKILNAGAQDFIQKPFSLGALSEKLRGVLEKQGGS